MTDHTKLKMVTGLLSASLAITACGTLQRNSESKKDIAAYFKSMYIVLPQQTRNEIEGSGKTDAETPPAKFQEDVTRYCPLLSGKVDEALQNGFSENDNIEILSMQIRIGTIKEVCNRQLAEWKDKSIRGCKARVFDKVERLSGGTWAESAKWDWELHDSYHIPCEDMVDEDTYGDFAREKNRMREVCSGEYKIKWMGYENFRENRATYRRVKYECQATAEKNWSYKK